MRKADYRKISMTYDSARPLSEQNSELWMRLINQRIMTTEKIALLDLGCGTGRFSIAISKNFNYSIVGSDISKEMILKARQKERTSKVSWIVHDASLSPYVNESFDAVFMSHLLHHVDEPMKVIKECYRILKPNGTILNRYGAIENIRDDVEHTFFPETLEIDEARIPSISQVEKWFNAAGFESISSETLLQQSYKSTEEILERTKLKQTSVLTLISQSSFEQGLDALHEYIEGNPHDSWLFRDLMTLTVGKKLL